MSAPLNVWNRRQTPKLEPRPSSMRLTLLQQFGAQRSNGGVAMG